MKINQILNGVKNASFDHSKSVNEKNQDQKPTCTNLQSLAKEATRREFQDVTLTPPKKKLSLDNLCFGKGLYKPLASGTMSIQAILVQWTDSHTSLL